MRNILLLKLLLTSLLFADITLSEQEQKNWQIETQKAAIVKHVPLGEYMLSVTTPLKLLHTLSVPYEAQVTELKKVNFQRVKKGESLALLSATEWIEAQKQAIADAIKLMHNERIAERKAKLCEDGIIALKECFAADAEVRTDKIKLSASKTLLKAYGASDNMINKLYKDLSIFANMNLRSPVDGTIIQVNIQPGKSISSSSALFVIKKDGEDWLQSELPNKVASRLKVGENIVITIDKQKIESKILHISPVLNPYNQTREVSFSLAQKYKLRSGLRQRASISVKHKAFMIDKDAVVQNGNSSIIFSKNGDSYKVVNVNIIAESKKEFYIEYNSSINGQIATTSTSVLQNLLQQGE
ncbi:MAG: HlyD family efflux transporter periplasmic adaptor subunit [Helicobacteraceae bacterium]|nr:HlyD family efflux transporter periplasmic adaptor subunit [Helicobacteraceae bacterium]